MPDATSELLDAVYAPDAGRAADAIAGRRYATPGPPGVSLTPRQAAQLARPLFEQQRDLLRQALLACRKTGRPYIRPTASEFASRADFEAKPRTLFGALRTAGDPAALTPAVSRAVATWILARRATRVEPTAALRSE